MTGVDYWHARLRDGALSEDERIAFERWRADPRNAAAYAELERMMSAVDELMATPQMAAEADAALAKIRARRAKRVWSGPPAVCLTAAGGAALAAIAAVVVLTPLGPFDPRPPDRYRTEIGDREVVALPDGSRMTLNTASEARLAFSDVERRVVLAHGQALFDVASDSARPFVVAVDGATVTAVGTVFDVRKEEEAFTVTLVEGVVDVAVDAAPAAPEPEAAALRPPGDPASSPKPQDAPPAHGPPSAASNVVLQAGEQLTVSRADATTQRRVADVEATLGWVEGVLIFRRTRLGDAVAEVNRYTTRPLRLGDPTLADLELSGVFRAGDADAFAWSLEQTFPIRIVEQSRTRTVLSREQTP